MSTSQMAAAGFVALAVMAGVNTTTASAQYSNPVVNQFHSGGHHYDPFTDHHTISNHTTSIRESAFDADRNWIDPGSYRYVDRIVYDQYGRRVREHGYTWTSNGKPHGKLTRVQVTHYPGSTTYPVTSNYPGSSIHYPGTLHYPGSQWRPSGTSVISGSTQIYGQTQIYGGGSHHSPGVTQQNSETVLYSRQ
jgi:hypothetical protein